MSKIIVKYITSFIILLSINSSFIVFWNKIQDSSWSSQTISELKGSLKELKNEQQWLNYKLNILKWNKKLNSLFKKDLSLSEIDEIKSIVNNYKKINIPLNITLDKKSKNIEDITDTRKKIIAERISFYKKLIIYIDKTKLNNYKSYIKSDTQILRDKKNINAKIDKNKQILEKKVEKIKLKIKKHDEILNKKLKIIIKNKIDEKISNLKNNPKFKNLDKKIKKELLKKTINKINIKIIKLQKDDSKSILSLKKIEIYNIAIEKINILYNEY